MKDTNKNINDFDLFFKDKLGDAVVQPPDYIWGKIEQQLPPQKKKRRGIFWLFACLGLLVGGGSLLSYNILKNKILKSTAQVYTKDNNAATSTPTNSNSNNTTVLENQNSQGELTSNNKTTTTSINTPNTQTNNNVSGSKTTAAGQTLPSATVINGQELAKKQEARDKRLQKMESNNTTVNQPSNYSQSNSTVTNAVTNNSNQKSTTTKKIKNKNQTSANSSSTQSESEDFVSSDYNYKSDNNNKKNQIAASKNTATGKKTKLNKQNTSTNNPESASSNTTTQDLTQPITEPIRSANTEELLASNVPVKQMLTPLSSKEALRSLIEPNKLESLDMASNAGINDMNPNKDKQMRNLKQFAGYNINRGFHIGALIGIHNSWLSNKNYSKSESATEIKPKITFGKSYGMNLGYDFMDRWGIQTEIQYSEQGQKYSERNNYGLTNKDVKLNYIQVPVLIKYKNSFINSYNSKPIMFSVLFGPQFSYLVKKEILLNNQPVNSNPYNKAQGGIMAGVDFDLYMTRYMYLTIGARTSFGTTFQKNTPINYQIGVTTQFNFRVPKKIK